MNIGGSIYLGVVESRHDPLKLGRHQVRVFGVHSEKITDIPTRSLPWAITISTGSMSGIGSSPIYIEGTVVYLFFQDGDSKQMPVIIGSMQGAPMEKIPFPGGDQAEEDPGFVIPTETRVIPVDAKVEPEYTYSGTSYLDEIKSQSSDSDGSTGSANSNTYLTSSIFGVDFTIIRSYEQGLAILKELTLNYYALIEKNKLLGYDKAVDEALTLVAYNQYRLAKELSWSLYPRDFKATTNIALIPDSEKNFALTITDYF